MRDLHLRNITLRQPAPAQFESLLQLVSLLNGLLGLVQNFRGTFPKEEA